MDFAAIFVTIYEMRIHNMPDDTDQSVRFYTSMMDFIRNTMDFILNMMDKFD